jgi:hypothetical protein
MDFGKGILFATFNELLCVDFAKKFRMHQFRSIFKRFKNDLQFFCKKRKLQNDLVTILDEKMGQ